MTIVITDNAIAAFRAAASLPVTPMSRRLSEINILYVIPQRQYD